MAAALWRSINLLEEMCTEIAEIVGHDAFDLFVLRVFPDEKIPLPLLNLIL